MATNTEEIQAKEFLKRAEIRTMRKDLRALREVDALSERNKIAKIKTLEEQLDERKRAGINLVVPSKEKIEREEVLERNAGQERIAEKDLKNYATEQERQQIFLFESQRLGFEKQIDAIDEERDPALKLEKNKLLLQKRDRQEKLNFILEQEQRLENEQKFTTEKEQSTTVATQRKSLEQSRWDLDKKIQDVEKKRWEAEKQIEETDKKINRVDKSSDELVTEKNELRDKVLGIDKLLRDVYSAVMAREEEKRKGQAQEQIIKREILSKIRTEKNETVQRQQRVGFQKKNINDGILSKVPVSIREKITKSFEAEEKQRQKFMQEVEDLSINADTTKNILPPPPKK